MKKRGEDLTRHYRQAYDYWGHICPGRPRYVMLCNFDEFWVYDFDTQMDAPVDRVKVAELETRWGALGFLFPKPLVPIFGNDHVAVTRKAADQLADCFNLMVHTGRPGGPVDQTLAQRFILQMLVALFAEDIGMLPRYLVDQLLEGCKTKQDSRDLIGGLFEAMNTREKTADDRYQGVDYFNGGLFADPARVELRIDEVGLLKAASHEDWSKVQPEIFGTLFQHSLGKVQRRAFGQHFTHPTDIMKIVGPTIVEPWRKLIEEAETRKRLWELLQRMHEYIVLDPACGSGNFLYIGYRELKRLERRIYERMAEMSGKIDPSQMLFGFVSARQFFGIDINPFAVELAKVTMMIARKLAIDELHITEKALPLDNLDDNFKAADALIDAQGNPVQWPSADVFIGNPPFLGSRFFAKERGYDHANAVHAAYPEVPKMADYCVYWFRKTHDLLVPCTAADPVAGRAGLVGTQNVRNGASREGGLDHVVRDGTIIEAVDNQPWSGEANVNVSIVNWVKTQDSKLLPSERRLWFKAVRARSQGALLPRGSGPAGKRYELDFLKTRFINSALSEKPTVSAARVLSCNVEPKLVFQGQNPVHEGFFLNREEADEITRRSPKHEDILFPYMNGRDLVEDLAPTRWVIDFGQRGMTDAAYYEIAFSRVRDKVMNHVLEKAEAEKRATGKESTRWTRMAEKWWQFRDYQPGTMAAIARIERYIACPRVTKRPIFVFISKNVHPDAQLAVFSFVDDYSYGVLQSDAHWQWFVSKCSKLTERFRYTAESVYDTFAWPQFPTKAQVDAVAEAGRQVRLVRGEALSKIHGGLRRLLTDLHQCTDGPFAANFQ